MNELEKFQNLERKQLESRIAHILKKPLMIVVAPMGYGKTTAVHNFLNKQKESACVWISLGQDEVDDSWLWRKLCEKIEIINKELYNQIKELRFPRVTQEIDCFIQIIKDNIKKPAFFILDDFHQSSSESVKRLITKLVYEDISNLHIILISRIYPELPYEEMLLKGYGFLIDQQQLTLKKEEIEEIFEINGISLTKSQMEEVERYTDGWISAVYLVLLDYKKIGRLRLSVSIMHLLKTSIYDKLPEQAKNIFMKMSLFDDFSIEEACYTARCDINPVFLEELMEKIGFLYYDAQTNKYTMHTLLRSVSSIELEHTKINKKMLYNRCAEWNENNKNYMLAILYYKKAENIKEVFRILEEKRQSLLYENTPFAIIDFFHNVSLEECLAHPIAYFSYIYMLLIEGNVEEGKHLFEEAKKAYREHSIGNGKEQWLEAELLIIESLLEFNNLETVNVLLKKASVLLNRKPSVIFDSLVLTHGAPESLILWHNTVGNLENTVKLEKEYAKRTMRLFNRIEGGWDVLYEAEYQFTIGKISDSVRLAKMAAEKSNFRKQTCVTISSYYLLMRAAIYYGNPQEFERLMEELKKQMKSVNRSVFLVDYDLAKSYLYGTINRLDKVAPWLQEFDLEACNHIVRSARSSCIAYAVFLQQNKQWIFLDAIAEQMLVPYKNIKHIYVMIYAYIYKTIAIWHLEGIDVSFSYLQKAFELAKPDKIIMPFVENAKELFPILERYNLKLNYTKTLLPYCIHYMKSLKAFERKKEEMILTERELELMKLVRNGYRNSKIAEELCVAQVTVEKALTIIYRKLNVTNRTAAILKAEELYQL